MGEGGGGEGGGGGGRGVKGEGEIVHKHLWEFQGYVTQL